MFGVLAVNVAAADVAILVVVAVAVVIAVDCYNCRQHWRRCHWRYYVLVTISVTDAASFGHRWTCTATTCSWQDSASPPSETWPPPT